MLLMCRYLNLPVKFLFRFYAKNFTIRFCASAVFSEIPFTGIFHDILCVIYIKHGVTRITNLVQTKPSKQTKIYQLKKEKKKQKTSIHING